MESIPSTSLLGVRKNTSGLWLLVQAPTANMTLDTTASTYAIGCEIVNVADGSRWFNNGTVAVPSWQRLGTNVTFTAVASPGATGASSTISDAANIVVASSDAADANSIIVLPTAYAGKELRIITGATGLELRSPSTTTISINGGTGSAAESALAANSMYELNAFSTTAWRGSSITSTGQVLALEVAAN